jgi:hypothetical protein
MVNNSIIQQLNLLKLFASPGNAMQYLNLRETVVALLLSVFAPLVISCHIGFCLEST